LLRNGIKKAFLKRMRKA